MSSDGGPPLKNNSKILDPNYGQNLQQCTGPDGPCTAEALRNYCGSVGVNDPICVSLAGGAEAADLISQPPVSCVVELINNYMTCGEKLTTEQEQAGYKAFVDVTGYKPLNFEQVFNTMQQQSDQLFRLNSFYFFIPVLILILIIIWILVFASKLTWPPALFFSILAIYILWGFSIAYRIAAENTYHKKYDNLKSEAKAAQANFESSVAYFPQGLLASSCAVVCNGDCPNPDGCWTCNEGDCKPCTCKGTKSNCRLCKGTNKIPIKKHN